MCLNRVRNQERIDDHCYNNGNATVQRLSAMAEQTYRREKALHMLKKVMKSEIADKVKPSTEQKKETIVENQICRECS